MSKQPISKSDFTFRFSGHGHYKVTYYDPFTGRIYSAITTDMQLIDLTKNEEHPKKINLNSLKRICKS